MRVKFLACLLGLALLLVSATTASASPVKFAFPVIQPTYGSNDGDMARIVGLIGDIAAFTEREIAGHGANVSTVDYSALSTPVTSIPGPEAFMAALVPPGSANRQARDNINKTLIGKNITYTSIAGKPLNYTITADSIKSIEGTIYKNEPAWKVRVGEGLAWDLILDAPGKNVLDTRQLFAT